MKKWFQNIALCVLFLISYSVCAAQTSRGTYRIQRKKSDGLTQSTINGSIIDFATCEPLKATYIKIGSTFIQADTRGNFQHTLSPGKYRMQVGFIGYHWLSTSKISLRKGEQITILFYLKENTSPVID